MDMIPGGPLLGSLMMQKIPKRTLRDFFRELVGSPNDYKVELIDRITEHICENL